jgi:peptidoglycan lytic transglycosylase
LRRPRRSPPLLAAALLAGAAACAPSPPSRPEDPRFVVGEPYSKGGVWSYPREDYGLAESGLAVVLPDAWPGRRTANGEVHDPAALTAAHRTLQLPAVVKVWNLDTGREVRVRVNDRGPERPGRVIGLSRRAAELLGVGPGEPARVRVAVDPEASRAAIARLAGAEGPRLAVAAAPVGPVEREQLAPLPGARTVAGGGAAAALRPASVALAGDAPGPQPRPPARLPEDVAQRGAVSSRLVVEAGTFFRRDLAERRAATVGGVAEAVGAGRQPQYRVRLGPFSTAGEADRALEAALGRGIPDAKIVLD